MRCRLSGCHTYRLVFGLQAKLMICRPSRAEAIIHRLAMPLAHAPYRASRRQGKGEEVSGKPYSLFAEAIPLLTFLSRRSPINHTAPHEAPQWH